MRRSARLIEPLVGNLLLARTNERIREVGVRIALGAPRTRLIAQITLENAILCAIGGVVALFVAGRALELTNGFMRTAFDNLPFWWTWGLDSGVVTAAGVAVGNGWPSFKKKSDAPDAILFNGQITTMDARRSTAEAIAASGAVRTRAAGNKGSPGSWSSRRPSATNISTPSTPT